MSDPLLRVEHGHRSPPIRRGTIRRGARDESRWQEISYLVFDVIGSPAPVEDRWKVARKLVPDGEMSIDAVIASKRSCISLVPQTVCKGKDHLMEMLHEVQEVGGEGCVFEHVSLRSIADHPPASCCASLGASTSADAPACS